MSDPRQRRVSFVALGIILLAVIVSGLLIIYRQQVIDTVRASQFTPSSAIGGIRDSLKLTPLGELYFNSSQPSLQSASRFNQSCPQSEVSNPVVGCYTNQLIYIYDVKNTKLDGIEETTAAHELLHAAYERMSENERAEVDAELQKAYKAVKTKELETRMAYYQKNEPGEENNELHSILGTEFAQLGSALEAHYAKFFTDRSEVLAYYQRYQAVFSNIIMKLDTLAATINARTSSVSQRIRQYNRDSQALSGDVDEFKNRQFTDQSELDSARSALIARQNELKRRQQSLQGEIAAIEPLRQEYDTLRKEYEALSISINSNLEPAPSLE